MKHQVCILMDVMCVCMYVYDRSKLEEGLLFTLLVFFLGFVSVEC